MLSILIAAFLVWVVVVLVSVYKKPYIVFIGKPGARVYTQTYFKSWVQPKAVRGCRITKVAGVYYVVPMLPSVKCNLFSFDYTPSDWTSIENIKLLKLGVTQCSSSH